MGWRKVLKGEGQKEIGTEGCTHLTRTKSAAGNAVDAARQVACYKTIIHEGDT